MAWFVFMVWFIFGVWVFGEKLEENGLGLMVYFSSYNLANETVLRSEVGD